MRTSSASRVGSPQACRDELEPPLQPLITADDIDGRSVVVVEVAELPASQKPCFIKSRGIVHGAFLRVAGSNRKLSQYETGLLFANRTQPRHDLEPVPGTSLADLDPEILKALVGRVRTSRGQNLATADEDTLLQYLGVLSPSNEATLAGLLALGRYPQRFLPELNITFAFFATSDSEPLADGTRFLDSASIDGPIPFMLDEAMRRIGRNMRRRADRIEIENPGGLHGPVSKEALEAGDPVSSSRNATLAKLLEDVVTDGGRAVAENRGSGMAAMLKALRDAHLSPPDLIDEISRFIVRFRSATLVGDETASWIRSLGQAGLSDRQIAALALAMQGGTLTNSRYRALTGCDAITATRELRDLRNRGILTRSGVGHRAHWQLAPDLQATPPEKTLLPGRLTGEGRKHQIRRLLQTGDKSTRELAEATGLGKQSVRNYLNALRADGVVEPTNERIRSPATRWRLTTRSDLPAGQTTIPL